LRTVAPPVTKLKVEKRAYVGQQRSQVKRMTALADGLDVLDPRIFANHQLQHAVGLIFQPPGALVALEHRRHGARSDDDQGARVNRFRLLARGDEDDVDRSLQDRARSDRDHDAIGGQRRIQRQRWFVGRND